MIRNLLKKAWVFIRVLNTNPNILRPGFLNQSPTLQVSG